MSVGLRSARIRHKQVKINLLQIKIQPNNSGFLKLTGLKSLNLTYLPFSANLYFHHFMYQYSFTTQWQLYAPGEVV